MLDLARAVANLFRPHADYVQHRHIEVRGRSAFRITNVTSALESPVRASREDKRQIEVDVPVAVADAAAVDDHRMIKQRSVAVLRGLQLLQEHREHLDVMLIDLLNPLYL